MALKPEPSESGTYALDSHVVIRVVDEPLPESPPDIAFEVEFPGFVSPNEVAGIVFDDDPATPAPHYTLDLTYQQTEWGASGATAQLVLNVAATLSAEAILAGIYALARGVIKRNGIPLDPLDRDKALVYAQRAIARNYLEAPVNDLSLVAEEEDREGNSITFWFDGASGYTYTASVKQAPGMPSITSVSRSKALGGKS